MKYRQLYFERLHGALVPVKDPKRVASKLYGKRQYRVIVAADAAGYQRGEVIISPARYLVYKAYSQSGPFIRVEQADLEKLLKTD